MRDPITVDVVAEGLSWPVAVKFDAQGRLYTTNPPGIVRVDMQTGATEPVATVPYGIDNFAVDAHDRVFVSLLAEGTVGEALPNGELRMLGPAGMVMPGGVAIAPRADGETVYVADGWLLHEFDGATGELRRKVDNLGPNTVAWDGDNLLLSGWFGNGVVVWNPQTEKVVEEYYDFAMPLNAVRFGGDLVVAELGSGSVVRASGADPSQRTTLIKDLGVPAGLATNGKELWVERPCCGQYLAAGGRRQAAAGTQARGERAGSPRRHNGHGGRPAAGSRGRDRAAAGARPGDGRDEHACRGAGIQPRCAGRGAADLCHEQHGGRPGRRHLRHGGPRQRALPDRAGRVKGRQAPVSWRESWRLPDSTSPGIARRTEAAALGAGGARWASRGGPPVGSCRVSAGRRRPWCRGGRPGSGPGG